MSDAEVMTTAIIAMLYFRGNLCLAGQYLYEHRYIPNMLVTEQGEPVEYFLEPGAFSDTSVLALYNFDLPESSFVTVDKAYNDYTMENIMCETDVELIPLRKKNSNRPVPAYYELLSTLYSQGH